MSIFFSNREGQTSIEPSMISELIPEHINDMSELYTFENINIARAIEWMNTTNVDHKDQLSWFKLHNKMFCDVWKFSGKIRTVELNNPEFVQFYEVSTEIKQLEGNLKYWLENKTFDDKELAARVHEKLITIHPFRDGNGRWSRLLTNFICQRENLLIPSWSKAVTDDKIRRDYYVAAIEKARKEDSFSDLINFMYY